MNFIYQLLNAVIGACLASHACLIYDRFECESFIRSHSHCDNCGIPLSLLDQIPIFSFIFLKGKCKVCQASIPIWLFMFEILTGILFFKIDCLSCRNWPLIVFYFFFILCTIFDFKDNSFPTIFLFPLGLISIFYLRIYNLLQLVICLPVILLLLFYIFKQKMGSGDLFIYLFLIGIFGPVATNSIFLFASISILITFGLNKQLRSQPIPFLPYIYWGIIIYSYIFN